MSHLYLAVLVPMLISFVVAYVGGFVAGWRGRGAVEAHLRGGKQ